MTKVFVTVPDLKKLGLSETRARAIIWKVNDKIKKGGGMTVPGKAPRAKVEEILQCKIPFEEVSENEET